MLQWIIVSGKLSSLSCVGPFASRLEAESYATENRNEDVEKVWDILYLNAPGPDRPYQYEA